MTSGGKADDIAQTFDSDRRLWEVARALVSELETGVDSPACDRTVGAQSAPVKAAQRNRHCVGDTAHFHWSTLERPQVVVPEHGVQVRAPATDVSVSKHCARLKAICGNAYGVSESADAHGIARLVDAAPVHVNSDVLVRR